MCGPISPEPKEVARHSFALVMYVAPTQLETLWCRCLITKSHVECDFLNLLTSLGQVLNKTRYKFSSFYVVVALPGKFRVYYNLTKKKTLRLHEELGSGLR